MNVQCFFGSFPELDLGDLLLREIRESDAQDYYNYMSRDEMASYLTDAHRPKDLEQARKEVNYWGSLFPEKRSIYWAIVDKESNKMIGTAGYNTISFQNSRAEMSYDLDPDYWGKGIMLKSIKNILRFSDHGLGLVRVQATVIIDNQRSINLLERCGFKNEGLLEKYEVVENQHKNYFMYAKVN